MVRNREQALHYVLSAPVWCRGYYFDPESDSLKALELRVS
jgi:hypothetical protein